MVDAGSVIVLIFLAGAAFSVVDRTGAFPGRARDDLRRLLFGTLTYSWGFDELSGLFLLVGIIAGLSPGLA